MAADAEFVSADDGEPYAEPTGTGLKKKCETDETGTSKVSIDRGSASPETKSAGSKPDTFEEASHSLERKMLQHPEQITQGEASHLESLESHSLGGARPPKHSISAEAKRMATANDKRFDQVAAELKVAGVPINVHLSTDDTPSVADYTTADSRAKQSHDAKEENYQRFAEQVQTKIKTDPMSVTADDAAHLHSCDHRAHGHVEKHSLTSMVQRLSVENRQAAETLVQSRPMLPRSGPST